MIIRTDHLCKTYDETKNTLVINDVSFEVQTGEFLGIMGRSGCGKTTLLKMLGLIEPVSSGRLELFGKEVSNLKSWDKSEIRRQQIGFVFQDFQLIDALTARENIILPRILSKTGKDNNLVENLAEAVQISELLDRHPDGFSGGEKQRVAICRALINDPEIILADEPTGNLDSKSGKQVVQILEGVNKTLGKTIVMVTHDPLVASSCKRILFLRDGKIASELIRTEKDTAQSYLRSIIKMANEI